MTPKPAELLRAALLPVTNIGVMFALLMFWLLVSLAAAAGMLGIWLGIVIVPALFRYQIKLVETVGRGLKLEPLDTEFFRWISDWWSLFPAIVVIAIAWASYEIHSSAGDTAMTVFIVVMGSLYPAMVAVLSVTHSPLQAVSPVTLVNMLRSIGPAYGIAPVYLALIVFLSTLMPPLPFMVELLLELLLVCSLHTVIGCLIKPHAIFDDISIPDPVERTDTQVSSDIEKARANVLTYAYGLINRGNRDGGFRHLFDCIDTDPEIAAAWAWYFGRMLEWENQQPALFFAQHYIHDMLKYGENIPALKLVMRCRLIDNTFKPLTEDLPAVIRLAETHGNNELATVLKRY